MLRSGKTWPTKGRQIADIDMWRAPLYNMWGPTSRRQRGARTTEGVADKRPTWSSVRGARAQAPRIPWGGYIF